VAETGGETDAAPEIPVVPVHADGIGELFARLIDDAEAFVRAEIKLYRAEAIHRLESYKAIFAMGAIGALLGLCAVLLLLMALVFALAPYVGPAWAAVIVALLSLAISGILMSRILARIRGKDDPADDAPDEGEPA